MFKKKFKVDCMRIIDGEQCFMDQKTLKYIDKLRSEIFELEFKKGKLQKELETIKPVIETGTLKPAVSGYCKDCKFVVKSRWNGQILGCCKGNLCDAFSPAED